MGHLGPLQGELYLFFTLTTMKGSRALPTSPSHTASVELKTLEGRGILIFSLNGEVFNMEKHYI
jgi:hypothetical protein